MKRSCAASTPSRWSDTWRAWNYFESIDNLTNKAFIDKWMAAYVKKNKPAGRRQARHQRPDGSDVHRHSHVGAGGRAGQEHQRRRRSPGDRLPALQGAVGLRHRDGWAGRTTTCTSRSTSARVRRADGQFHVVWTKTDSPIRAQAWSPFIPDSAKKVAGLDVSVGVRQLYGAEVRCGGRGRGKAVIAAGARYSKALGAAVLFAVVLGAGAARAGELEDALRGLAAPTEEKVEESINKLGTLDDPRAFPALDALADDRLRADASGQVYIYDNKKREVSRRAHVAADQLRGLRTCTRSRSATRSAGWRPRDGAATAGLARRSVRLSAAEELAKNSSPEAAALLRKAFEKEKGRTRTQSAGAGCGAHGSPEQQRRRAPGRGGADSSHRQ